MKRLALSLLLVLVLSTVIVAHPRHSNPIIGELNDYLAALQLLKQTEPEAEELFRQWVRLREESWNIRKLTEEKGYFSSDSIVVDQVEKTSGMRRDLRDKCLLFFDASMSRHPSARIEIGTQASPQIKHVFSSQAIGSRGLILLRLENSSNDVRHIELFGSQKSQVLFWRQSIEVVPNSRRFCFAIAAPSDEGTHTNSITIRTGVDEQSLVNIAIEGLDLEPRERVKVPDRHIAIQVNDAETGRIMAARAEVTDEEGKAYWEPLIGTNFAVETSRYGRWETPLWPLQPGPYFYTNGAAILGVEPKGKTLSVFHGFEYRPVRTTVPDSGSVNVRLQRWINMPARGWYSGQTHIHTTEQGLPVPFFDSWPLISQAEGLHVSHILTLKGEWTTHAIYANEYPMGQVPIDHSADHIIVYGEEYRSNPYGHLGLLDLEELIQPISSGALGELGGPDYPPNAWVLDQAISQGATTVGAHFGLSVLEGNPISTPWPSTGFEMPIDVALGKLQVAEVYGNGGQLDVWYKLLNCGFEIPATAGPDWVLKDTPRTYVFLGTTPLSAEAWTEALRLGRSFVTRGPMIFLTVDGHRPGTRIQTEEKAPEVLVEATALMPDGPVPVEVIVNGNVVATGVNLRQKIRLEDSAWIAARCENAHTNPVYVDLPGRPRGYREDAEEFIQSIKRLENWVKEKAIFESPEQRNTVLSLIDEGMAVYLQVVERAKWLGREK